MTKSLSPEEWVYYGGINLSLKHLIIPVLLVFLFTAGLSFGQDAANNTSTENVTLPENITVPVDAAALVDVAAPENVTAPVDATAAENVTEAPVAEATAPNLQYIWSITGIEPEQVTMVLSQEGEDLFGQAKFEPESGEPWNAVVVGSVSGDKVDLVITALKGETLVATKMAGTFAAEAINGQFFQVSDGKIASRGDFSAMWINPDVSSYTPAVIAQPETEPVQTDNVTTPAATTADTTQQPVQLGQSTRFVDVRKYKDQIGPGGDLSGIPPGMGGAGL
jgi:hypothetical protein